MADKEDIDLKLNFIHPEVAFWDKALKESDITLLKLKDAIKYETATNEMCKKRLEEAKEIALAEQQLNNE